MTTTARINTLASLLDVLLAAPDEKNTGAQTAYAARHGLPVAHGEIDYTSLPTFGGDEPTDTVGVWSWDAADLLVGDGPDDLRIVSRAERAGE